MDKQIDMGKDNHIPYKMMNLMQRLGIKPKEAAIYAKLIEMGPISITELATVTNIPRATTHRLVGNLISKKLLLESGRNGARILAAEDPVMIERLLLNQEVELKNKINEVNSIRENFQDLIRSLSELSTTSNATHKYVVGKENVQAVYTDILKSQRIYAVVNFSRIVENFPENITLFRNALRKNPEMKVFDIIENLIESKFVASTMGTNYFYKSIPDEVEFFNMDLMIGDDKLVLVNLEKPYSALIINSEIIVKSMLVIHKLLWGLLD